MTSPVDQPNGRLDRRSALKKAAVGGAIVWTAPTVLSSKVLAQDDDVCTPKCIPTGGSGITVTGSFEVQDCVGGSPGLENVFVVITYDSVTGLANCPCSTDPTITIQDLVPAEGVNANIGGPGNVDIQVTISATYTCFDNGGTEFTVTCSGTADAGTSGNCNSRGGDVYDFNIALDSCLTSC